MRPKAFTERVIRKLNEACNSISKSCKKECDDVAWCDECWHVAFGKQEKPADSSPAS
jgi:hypothetical protein